MGEIKQKLWEILWDILGKSYGIYLPKGKVYIGENYGIYYGI